MKGICKYCGEEFTQNTRGKRKNYCNKKECYKKARAEINKKWYSNKIRALKGNKMKIKQNKTIIYSNVERNISKEDFIDVIEYSKELGAIRFEAIQKIKECQAKRSEYDKYKEVFIHDVESLAGKDEVTDQEIIDVFKKHIDKILDRRKIKDKEDMYSHLIAGLMKNPNEYVTEYIKQRNNRTYNPNKNGGNVKGKEEQNIL